MNSLSGDFAPTPENIQGLGVRGRLTPTVCAEKHDPRPGHLPLRQRPREAPRPRRADPSRHAGGRHAREGRPGRLRGVRARPAGGGGVAEGGACGTGALSPVLAAEPFFVWDR